MKRTFNIELGGNDTDMPANAPLSKFKSFFGLQMWMKKHDIHYNKEFGEFFDNANDEDDEDFADYFWWIWDDEDPDEYNLGNICEILEKLTGTEWYEIMENCFTSPNCNLKKAFEALKQIDGIEIDIDD